MLSGIRILIHIRTINFSREFPCDVSSLCTSNNTIHVRASEIELRMVCSFFSTYNMLSFSKFLSLQHDSAFEVSK